ncbi:MAG: zinc-dependent alcohol dehydrogenase [Nitrososphaera sp.]|uniref:Putative alcohol dehydrogenase superfamily, zinc-containing n=1 Tax=Nitrososphaera gargensis (strain Ga9.2) TaxID=1237085 RepID=K0IF68_NITGG|nr:zinc-dependent alcohol dehydrogenase [Candidatus Nitrososphaera gargensis]AFU60011.1 putative alcohol dehydrogenase superfamily, zinc-containing [Candidatus Nitrososphaera gargensis Ga9.2]
MKAVVYHGPMDVRVDDKPKPKIEHQEDIVLKVTRTTICGSDLHLYHGNVKGMEPGQTLGHEFAGVVEQVGDSVDEVKAGDRVVIPFNISCGRCWFCRHQFWSQCDRSNPKGELGAVYGYGQMMGGYDGGQAEYVRVPYANTDPLKIPDNVSDDQALFLTDVLATGYFGADIANVQPGDDVAVFGAGPVGYFSAMSSLLRGAARVFVVDHWPTRLDKVAKIGAEPINFDKEDPVERIKKEAMGKGAVCIDAVGYEAVGHHSHDASSNPAYIPQNSLQVINWIVQVAHKFSTVGIPGVYMTEFANFPFGQFFQRELQIKMGQCPVKLYNEQLLHLIEVGRIDPTQLISHRMKLDEAKRAYDIFDKKGEATKIVLTP